MSRLLSQSLESANEQFKKVLVRQFLSFFADNYFGRLYKLLGRFVFVFKFPMMNFDVSKI